MNTSPYEIKEERDGVYIYNSGKKIASCFSVDRAKIIVEDLKKKKQAITKNKQKSR